MRTLLPDPPPADLAALLERRRRLGQDRKDEVWEGVLHVAPAPNSVHADIQLQLAEIRPRAPTERCLAPHTYASQT
ncbi:MAG: hypothetical protein ACYCU0_15425 [Solirubrobacteraceae bacterium]